MKSIKDIVSECFPKENWEMKDWNEDAKTIINRKDIDRDSFMQKLTEAFGENQVMRLNGEWHRGIGKTSFILEVAEEYRIPLLVDTEWRSKLIKETYKNLEVYSICSSELRGLKNKYILLDLNCSVGVIEKVKRAGLIPLGFICSPKLCEYELI